MRLQFAVLILLGMVAHAPTASAEETPVRNCSDPPVIRSSWDDLLEEINTREDWQEHRNVLLLIEESDDVKCAGVAG